MQVIFYGCRVYIIVHNGADSAIITSEFLHCQWSMHTPHGAIVSGLRTPHCVVVGG